jgi:putative endonuclease
MTTQELAREGEDAAAAFLTRKGYNVHSRNFHFGRNGEIDIIASMGDVTAFVEVKTRSHGTPEEALYSITPTKQKQLMRIAQGYMYVKNLGELNCRFDIIVVMFRGGQPHIVHYENAFTSMHTS